MSPIRISLILLIGLVCCSLVLGQRDGGRGRSYGGGMDMQYGTSRGGHVGGGFGGRGGRGYRSNLYNDDEVYGYEATYPGGEALYVNYRNSEARAKRGQEFARSSPYSSARARGGQTGYQEQRGRDERGAGDNGGMW